MEIMVWCPVCEDAAHRKLRAEQPEAEEAQGPDEERGTPILTRVWHVRIGDSNTAEAVCPEGHEFLVQLQAQKYEVLFELAVMAHVDGYYREAVSSAATAIERAHEYYTKTAMGMQFGAELAQTMWTALGRLSERQYGAFVATYVARERKAPPSLEKLGKIGKRNPAQLRNDAVHNGYIPSEFEALTYLGLALEYIRGLNDQLESPDVADLLRFEMEHAEAMWEPGRDIDQLLEPRNLNVGYSFAVAPFRARPDGRLDIEETVEEVRSNRMIRRILVEHMARPPA